MKLTRKQLNQLQLKWSDSNSKLAKDGVIAFNLPAFKAANGQTVCHGASAACSNFCYARQGRFTMNRVQNAYEHNYAMAKQNNFYELLYNDLAIVKHKYVRVHSSGDFFTQRYFKTWLDMAKEYPDKIFYCYSKIAHVYLNRMANDQMLHPKQGVKFVPSNFIIVQSLGGKFDNAINEQLPVSKVFKSVEHMQGENEKIDAPWKHWVDASHSDTVLFQGHMRIGLIYHGINKTKVQFVQE